MASEGYHEPIEELTDEVRDFHRAVVSLMEELEAVDWYNQRVSRLQGQATGGHPGAQPRRGDRTRLHGAGMDPPPQHAL